MRGTYFSKPGGGQDAGLGRWVRGKERERDTEREQMAVQGWT